MSIITGLIAAVSSFIRTPGKLLNDRIYVPLINRGQSSNFNKWFAGGKSPVIVGGRSGGYARVSSYHKPTPSLYTQINTNDLPGYRGTFNILGQETTISARVRFGLEKDRDNNWVERWRTIEVSGREWALHRDNIIAKLIDELAGRGYDLQGVETIDEIVVNRL